MNNLAGQWIGGFNGTNKGLAVLDLDEDGKRIRGSFCAFDDDANVPSVFSTIEFPISNENIQSQVTPQPIHPTEVRFMNPDEVPPDTFPTVLNINLGFNDRNLEGTWSTNIDTSGSVKLKHSAATEPSLLVAESEVLSWSDYKEYIAGISSDQYRFIFRGQGADWRLRTSFHRTKRKDLSRYWSQDIPRVRNAVVGKTGFNYDPSFPENNGALLHLLQHHGYPTPLLDWTYSPYIAAYFAFSGAGVTRPVTHKVRIFMFDASRWSQDFNQILNVVRCQPHFSLLDPLALGNDRALPQQSMATVTNVDDIETYISFQEQRRNVRYLKAFDLPLSQRTEVLRDLGLMGISPGSLFPGLEGLCREYRDRNFGYQ